MDHIDVQMLGAFTLRCGEKRISEENNRSKRVWSLLAYLICHRGTPVSQKKLIEVLWGDDPASSNPENVLRITLHRLRSLLDGLYPGAGKELIVYKNGGYGWNTQVETLLDSDRFEELCSRKSASVEDRLRACMDALELYKGDFLERQSGENWVIPVTTHFHNLFVSVSIEVTMLLSGQQRHTEAARICWNAIEAEPYHEPLYQLLMRELAAIGDHKSAAAVYETLRKRLFDDFGIHPNEKTRAVYRETAHIPGDRALPIDEVLEHLQEPEVIPGALQCDYDYFKVLCHAQTRAMERNGTATHVALLSAAGLSGEPLPKRSIERIMAQIGQQFRINLRRGDVISRCSITQYILMLPKANYEDSCMVCRRIINAYHRAYPHTAVHIRFMVQPLSPGISVP